MKIFQPLFLIALLLLLNPAKAQQTYNNELGRITKGLPQDIVDFAGRAEACTIWSAQESDGSEQRTEEIRNAVISLKCIDLGSDRKKLDDKYKSDMAAKKALEYIGKNYIQ